MRALSIRHPWAELILRGIKTIEVRSSNTKVRGRVYIYASLGRYPADLEDQCSDQFGLDMDALPRGVLVGTVEITGSRPLEFTDSEAACFEIEVVEKQFAWLVANPERASELLKPTKHPQPVWFNPF